MTTPTLRLLDKAINTIESNRRAHVSGPNKPPYPDYDNITQEILADYKRCRTLIFNLQTEDDIKKEDS